MLKFYATYIKPIIYGQTPIIISNSYYNISIDGYCFQSILPDPPAGGQGEG